MTAIGGGAAVAGGALSRLDLTQSEHGSRNFQGSFLPPKLTFDGLSGASGFAPEKTSVIARSFWQAGLDQALGVVIDILLQPPAEIAYMPRGRNFGEACFKGDESRSRFLQAV